MPGQQDPSSVSEVTACVASSVRFQGNVSFRLPVASDFATNQPNSAEIATAMSICTSSEPSRASSAR